MPLKEGSWHSVLVVSSSDAFDALVRKSLSGSAAAEFRKNAAAARRCLLERYFDLVVINSPLSDESGIQLAMDMAEQCSASFLLVVPSAVYEEILERLTDFGILVIEKPMPRGRLDKAVRYLMATQDRVRRLEKELQAACEKAEEIRIVSKAKLILVETKHMTEDEAHRLIGRLAMNHGTSRRRIAEEILEEAEPD